jgi:hypothetical protein
MRRDIGKIICFTIWCAVSISSLIGWWALAQETGVQYEDTGSKQLLYEPTAYEPTPQWDADVIGSIKVEFCDTGEDTKVVNEKELSITTQPDRKLPLCFRFQNMSDYPYIFTINFVDGLYNNMGNKSCDLEDEKSKFGNFVTNYDQQLQLKWWEIREVRPILSMPASAIGKFLGCLTIRPRSDTDILPKAEWGMSVIVRRGVALEVWNKGILQTALAFTSRIAQKAWDLKFDNGLFAVQRDKQANYIVQLGAVNSWAVTEDLQVQWKITDIFWKSKPLAAKSLKLVAGRSDLVTYSTKLPWYKMWFTVEIQASHTPDVMWIPSEYIQWVKEKETNIIQGTFFVFPWWLVIVIVSLIVLWMMKKKEEARSKKQGKGEGEG